MTLATNEARCSCCDGPDGLGFYHLPNPEQLRRFLDTPGHETNVDIDVADIPGEPYGMAFVSAGEAEAWLEEYDERVREELSIERVLGPDAMRA